VLKVECGGPQVYVLDPASGAQIYHQSGYECRSDNSYYDARLLGGHLTVVNARTGATVWQTPLTTTSMPCALSGDRLMLARIGSPGGAEEYSISTHQLVFNRQDHTTVWRFGPDGYIAACDTNENLIGISPTGSVAWKTNYSCPSYDSPFSFGRSTVDLESGADVDIVTGRLLGAFTYPPIASNGYGGGSLPDGAVAYLEAHRPLPGACPGPGSEVMFLGPYAASPWLTGASLARDLEFSHRALAVEIAGPCSPPFIGAWDEHGFVRWLMPTSATPDLSLPVGDDMATNGGDESSALLGVNATDGALELVGLP